jgi:hypothetical protein
MIGNYYALKLHFHYFTSKNTFTQCLNFLFAKIAETAVLKNDALFIELGRSLDIPWGAFSTTGAL